MRRSVLHRRSRAGVGAISESRSADYGRCAVSRLSTPAPETYKHRTNYFLDAPSGHHTDIANFERVIYRDVYPGVDVVFYGKNGQIEYDFILKPDADPAKIQFAFAGAQKIEVDPAGDLLIHTAAGTLKQHQPQVYQEHDGQREAVAASYRVLLGNQ